MVDIPARLVSPAQRCAQRGRALLPGGPPGPLRHPRPRPGARARRPPRRPPDAPRGVAGLQPEPSLLRRRPPRVRHRHRAPQLPPGLRLSLCRLPGLLPVRPLRF